jgi:ribosomal protein S18 acetylase RimI-like enzyme
MPDPTPLRIRDARADELDMVASVMVAAYEEYIPPEATGDLAAYREEIRDVRSRQAHATLIVAAEGDRILAAVTYFPDAGGDTHTAWPRGWASIRLLAVHPEARGRGIGRALTEECIQRARAAGARAVGLHTTVFMAVARAMYERMGFLREPRFDFSPMPGILVMAYQLTLSRSVGRREEQERA